MCLERLTVRNGSMIRNIFGLFSCKNQGKNGINVINIPKICPMALIASQFIIFYSSSSMNFRLVKNSIYNTFYLIFRTLSVYTACGQYSLINAIANIFSASLILGPNTISISSSTLSSISKNN